MNGLPEPFTVGVDRVVYQGKQYMVTDRAPNADGWRYIGTPCDLAGPDVRFSHEEALPVRPRAAVAPRTPGLVVEGPLVQEATPEQNLVQAVGAWYHGRLTASELAATYLLFTEGQTA